jgi:hypothetical protein
MLYGFRSLRDDPAGRPKEYSMDRNTAERLIFSISARAWSHRWFEDVPARRAAGDAMRALKQAREQEARGASVRVPIPGAILS